LEFMMYSAVKTLADAVRIAAGRFSPTSSTIST